MALSTAHCHRYDTDTLALEYGGYDDPPHLAAVRVHSLSISITSPLIVISLTGRGGHRENQSQRRRQLDALAWILHIA